MQPLLKKILVFAFAMFIFSLTGFSQDGQNAYPNQNPDGSYYHPVLLVFSGSDWCSNCIRFNQEVLTDPTFIEYAENRFAVYKADFPQRKKLPEETVNRNEELAERYNPQGFFPKIVLLGKDQSVIATIPYTHQSAGKFIDQLRHYLPTPELKEYHKKVAAMGSFFEFIVVESLENETRAIQLINEGIDEVNRVENLISEWIDNSEVSMINRNAGVKAVQVSPELYQLIKRSIATGNLTQGAFDITFQALSGLWRFDGTQQSPPNTDSIQLALQKVGYQKIQLLDSNKVYLPTKGMAISFGGIGQGYAVDQVKNYLISKGVQNFVINSSGDIFAKGRKADGSPWKVGIANPFDKTKMIRWLEVDNEAVVTSGNYERYFEYEGTRYAHIINPKTGWPTQGIVSATVISPVTEMSDALATAIFVLGKEVALDLINQLPGTHCIIIDDDRNITYSNNLEREN